MKRLLLFCLLIVGFSAHSQTVSATLKQGITLQQLFTQIEEQSDYKFAFTDQIDLQKKYAKETKQLSNVSVEQLLQTLRKEFSLQFTLVGNNITVKNLSAQKNREKFTLSGIVTDDNNLPLPGVNIFVEEANLATATDENGRYSITLPAARYTVILQFIGFEKREERIGLFKNNTLSVQLREDAQTIQEVLVIQNNKATNIRKPQMSTNSLTMQEIKRIPVAMGEPDPLKSLLTLPGVTNAGEASSGFNVRGGAADQNLILLDGAPIYNDSHMFGFFSVFNADAIKSLDLYKGGIPAKFGGRVSSILDVKQQTGSYDSLQVNGGIGLISSKLMVEGPIKKDVSSFMLSGRTSYAHLFLKLADNNNSALFYDLNGRFNYKLNENNSLHFSGYYGNDVFDIANNFESTYGNAMATLQWNHKFSDDLSANLSMYYSDYKFGLSINSVSFNWDSEIRSYGLKYDWTHSLSQKLNLNYGLEGIYYNFNPGTLSPRGDDSPFNFLQLEKKYAFEPSAYLDVEHTLTEKLNFRYGFRYSQFYRFGSEAVSLYANNQPAVYNPTFGIYQEAEIIGTRNYSRGEKIASFDNFEPRAALSYAFNNDNSVKASYNRMSQYLHILSNTQSPLPMNIWTPSGPYIKPQILDQYAIGYFRNFSNKEYSFETELFFKDIKNRIDYVDGADILANDNIEQVLLSGKARAYGLELLLRKNTGALTGWISYTLSRSEQKTEGQNPGEPGIAGGDWYLSPYDKLHNLNITANYDYSDKWSFAANFTLQSGRPVTFPEGYYEFQNIHIPSYSERNANRLPAFHHLDLAATYTPKPEKKKGWQSYWVFSVYNAYGRKNAASIRFGTNEDSGVNEATRLSVFGIIPSVSYNFKF